MLNQTFIRLVRLGIGHKTEPLSTPISWREIQTLSYKQGLSAVVLDSIEKLPLEIRPPKELSLQWIGDVLKNYENRYDLYQRTIAEMAGFYNSHGYKMMVLKGYGCSLDWPRPNHRPCGDIDIWLFGKQKEADSILAKEKGVKVDASHHHHTVYDWCGFSVENHYDFVNVHAHKSSAELEKVFKQLGADDSHSVKVKGETVYLPSPNLHALFLIRHMVSHFAAAEITLRQVLDWAFFVEKHTNEVDWVWLVKLLEKYHMKDFFNLINAICVEDLGYPVDIFPAVQFDPKLKDRVRGEILAPIFPNEIPFNFNLRIKFKFRRWLGNKWKRKLCYNESDFLTFCLLLYSHIIKPKTI